MLKLVLLLLLHCFLNCSSLYLPTKYFRSNNAAGSLFHRLNEVKRTSMHESSNDNKDLKSISNSKAKSPVPLIQKHISLLISIWGRIHTLNLADSISDDFEAEDYSDFVLSDYYGAVTTSNKNAKPDRNRKLVDGLIKHFQFCRDTCAADGAFLMATQNEQDQDVLRLSKV